MKKRRILLGCFIATMSLVLSACDFLPSNLFPNLKNSSSQESSQRSRISRDRTSSEGPHVHEFSTEWSYNSSSHWHDATCGHNLKSEIGSHEFYSAIIKEATCTVEGEQVSICKICDYRKTVAIPTTDHTWYEYSRVEPTCYESGLSRRYCVNCGASTEEYLPPVDHDFEIISYKSATCSEPGYATMTCKRCGYMTEYEIPTTPHNWGYETFVEGQEGYLGYSLRTCRTCGTTRIAVRALDGMTTGSFKSSVLFDYGFMKLASNGQSISYTFNYPNAAYGKLYQHACYDNSSYYGYTYRTGAKNDYPYNFEMSLNGAAIDMSQSCDIPYEQFLENGEENPELMNYGYSRINNCLIGDVTLAQGVNTLTYTRRGSYSLWVDYFVFEVINTDHMHSVSSYWNADDNSHWHSCTDPNCPVPNSRIDSASHSFGEIITIAETTCHSDGIQRQICSICQYCKDTVIPATDHNYVNVGSFERVDDSVSLEEYGCEYCDQYVYRWNALQYDESLSNSIEQYNSDAVRFMSGAVENQNGEPRLGAHLVYKVYSPNAVSNVGLAFSITQSQGYPIFDITSTSSSNGYVYDDYGDLVPATKKYGLIVNGNEIKLGEDIYGTSSGVSTSTPRWYKWPVTLNLVAGINTIDIYCLMSSYRARMYEFQLTGVPFVEPNHTHVADNELHYDDNSHYNLCVGGDGVRMNEEPHTFTDYVTVTEATCSMSGEKVRTCTVCGYQQYSTIKSTGHSYGERYVTVAPTCTEYGTEEAVCSVCGEVGTWSISPLGHSWDEGIVTKEPTHSEAGERLLTCTVCGETMIKAIKPDHSWGSPTYIEASDGCVGYTKQKCLDDNAYKLDIKALDGEFGDGSYNYASAPDGYLRLNSAGMSISYRFNYNDHAIGKLYLRSTVGNFSKYSNRSYSYNGTGSNGCTFEFYVNGNLVDMSETKDKTFQELLGDGWTDPNLSSDYSPVDDCLIGTVELFNGINTIEYYRTGSFSLNTSDLILVVEHTDHEHTYSASYTADENYHWRNCTDPTCPSNGTTPKDPHDFVEIETSQQNSCNDQITRVYACSVCGYRISYKDSIEHSFDESQTYYGTNSDGKNFTVRYCPVCNKTVEAIQFADGDFFSGSYTSGKLTAGTTVQWRLPVYQTGTISIYIPCKMTSGNTGQTYNPSLYVINVNGANLPILMPSGTYDELGIGSSETKYFKWAEYEVSEADMQNGEIYIQFTSNNSNYRMIFDGEIRIEY